MAIDFPNTPTNNQEFTVGGITWIYYTATGNWQIKSVSQSVTANLSNATPLVESGAGSAGASSDAARGDHVHPAAGGAATWGSITGTLSSQTDLDTALNGKAPLASPTFTGTVTIPTLAVSSSTLVTNLNADQLDGQQGTYYTEMTLPFSRSGALTVGSGATDFMWPFAVTVLGVSASISTAPTGASVILDVDKNGTTIFTNQANRPTIAASATATAAEVTNMDITSFSVGDKIRVNVDQIGSTIAGSDLTVVIRYRRT